MRGLPKPRLLTQILTGPCSAGEGFGDLRQRRHEDWLLRWHSGKESTCQRRRCKRCGFDPWVRKIPWSRKWQPTLIFLPGKFYGQRSLVGYSPWGRKESDTAAKSQTQLSAHSHTHTHTHTHTGLEDTNGSPFLHTLCTGRGARKLHGGSGTRQQVPFPSHTKAPTLGLAPAGQSGIETPICCVCVLSHSVVSDSPWDSPGKNTGVGCCFLFQGHLPNPGIEPTCQVLPKPLPTLALCILQDFGNKC